MQTELETDYSYLAVKLLGVNGVGHESGNQSFCQGRDVPWLQDVDSNGDFQSDVWLDWNVEFRDVVIVDGENVRIATFNLTRNNLELPENYELLLQMLIDAATIRGDLNRDGNINLLDVHPFSVLFAVGKYQPEGDFNRDGTINFLDVIPFVDAIVGR